MAVIFFTNAAKVVNPAVLSIFCLNQYQQTPFQRLKAGQCLV